MRYENLTQEEKKKYDLVLCCCICGKEFKILTEKEAVKHNKKELCLRCKDKINWIKVKLKGVLEK